MRRGSNADIKLRKEAGVFMVPNSMVDEHFKWYCDRGRNGMLSKFG